MADMTSPEYAKVSFEVCAEFSVDATGAPRCCNCGWLDHEHDPVDIAA